MDTNTNETGLDCGRGRNAPTVAAIAKMADKLMREIGDAVTILRLAHQAIAMDGLPGDMTPDALTFAVLSPAERAQKLAEALYDQLQFLEHRAKGE